MSNSILKLTQEQKNLVFSFMERLKYLKNERRGDIATLTFQELKQIINPVENDFMKYILNIKPIVYGVSVEFLGLLPVPKNLIAIKDQKYNWGGEEKRIATQYLPKNIYKAFVKMNRTLKKSISTAPTGVGLLIQSGYRSPAYQFLTFLYLLQKHGFDFQKTLTQSTLPNYSEHGNPKKQAIDFINTKGVIWGDKICFDDTEEYKWLLKNANVFGFYLSYPKNNDKGIMFEPWHWRYENKI